MSEQAFHAAGLRFSCTRCSSCCRHESGYVYLSEADLARLARQFDMDYTAFIATWCRWVPLERNNERLALKEKSNFDCIFWNNGCTVYDIRPLQCRAFPFWDYVVCSPEAWKNAGADCPGINNGTLHPKEEIDHFVSKMDSEPIIERVVLERKIPRLGGNG